MEASISDVLKNIQAHRDQKQLQELVKSEEHQCHSLLALKLEEFKNLRKEDILSKPFSKVQVISCINSIVFFNRCHEDSA
jgi:hypothetical protein